MRRVLLIGRLLVLCLLLLACYRSEPPPPRACPITGLLLDATSFPVGASAGEILSPMPRAARDSAGRTIYLRKGLANHDVYRHASAVRAAQEFAHRRRVTFVTGEDYGPWENPRDLSYRSPIANQYYLACGIDHGIYMCIMVAQYEEYYIFFNAHMDEQTMTFSDLERALQAIDAKMANCLQKPLTPTTPTAVAE